MAGKALLSYTQQGQPILMPLRILVADDNRSVRASLGQFLRHHPDWVICAEAENGQEAVTKTIQFAPDVVVLDLAMPVMDGLEAAREIGNVLSEVPIFLYTLHSIPALEREAHRIGVREVVTKPHWESLLGAIERAAQKQ